MATYTENLNLLEKDPAADGSDTFNIQTMLNDNWDKIDAAVAGRETALSSAAAKAVPADEDSVVLVDSEAGGKTKRVLWSAAKTALGKVFSALGHNHAASDITSGILPVDRGGTGGTTAAEARAALGALSRPEIDAKITPVAYNVYQLMLQNDYDGKYTGDKKALLFDGFLDTAGIASRSDALCHQSGELCLTSSGQGDLVSGISSSYVQSPLTRTFTASGNGRLTGIDFRFQSRCDGVIDIPFDITVSCGDTVLFHTDYNQPNVEAWATVDVSFTLDTPVDLLDGERYIITVGGTSIAIRLYMGPSDENLGGTIHITPEAGAEAAMTSVAHDIPACGTLAAWVRHSGGSVALSLTDSAGTVHSLTAGDTTDTVNLQTGDACKETAFSLNAAVPDGAAAVTLTVTLGTDAKAEVFDYGLILIHAQQLDAYLIRDAVRSGSIQNILSVGDFFTVGRNGTNWLFQVAAFDYDVPVDPNYTHSMRLLMYPCFANVVFDAREAIFYAETELAAGAYWFADSRAGKYASFTLAQAVPAGGQIVLTGYGASPDYTLTELATYASQTATDAAETAAITVSDTAPSEGTQLTTVNDGNRLRWGSNNWLQSAIRQWLNSDAESGWWTPGNPYDRPQSSPADGFLHGIDADLLACIGKVRLRTGVNPADHEGTYGYSDNEERIFLPSRTEMGLGNYNDIMETPVAADGTATTDILPLFTGDADRIKYLSGVARYWWLRSPYPDVGGENSTHHVNMDGSLGSGSAWNGLGAVPACVIY